MSKKGKWSCPDAQVQPIERDCWHNHSFAFPPIVYAAARDITRKGLFFVVSFHYTSRSIFIPTQPLSLGCFCLF